MKPLVALLTVVLALSVALYAEGDGRGAGTYASEVAGARYLLHETARAPHSTEIHATLTSLSPVAITEAERR